MNIGAHISVSKGIFPSLDYAEAIGLNCLQLFSSAPQQWKPTSWDVEKQTLLKTESQKRKLTPIYVHGCYLINLGSDNEEILSKSITSLRSDLKFLHAIGGKGLIFHFGSHPGGWCEKRKKLIPIIHDLLTDLPDEISLLIENSAGSGSKIGTSLIELQAIQSDINSDRLGFCLDTAHAFASGVDLRQQETIEAYLLQVQTTIGLQSVEVIHFNDSKAPLGSLVDRHENIGEGKIGNVGLGILINHPLLKQKTFILETPGLHGQGPDRQNILHVKQLVSQA